MLNDGDKGVVLQRDRHTYALAPHLPCGIITPDFLRKLADVAEKYHAAAIKVTSAERIALIGLQERDIDAIRHDLGMPPLVPGQMTGHCVRSVKACPGTQFCKRARQDSLAVGMELDRRYHGRQLPGKMKIGVSGCSNQCAETCIKDIGLVGGVRGWMVLAGGNGGSCPRLAQEVTEEEVSIEQALRLVDQIVAYYAANARPGERLGELMERVGKSALLTELRKTAPANE